MFIASCTPPENREMIVERPGDAGKLRLPMKDSLRISLTTEPPTLDWHKGSDTVSNQILCNIMEGLMQYDLSDPQLRLKPGLAAKIESRDSARIWVITLRDDVEWSDGVKLTPQHVIDGWKRLLSKETAADSSYFLYPIKNAREYNRGAKDWKDVGVTISGENQITVELTQSMSYFPFVLTHHSTFPIRLDLVEKFGNRWTDPQNIVTLGPYRLTVWQHDKLVVLSRNENYYGAKHGDKPQIQFIVARIIPEQSTELSLFAAAQLDSVHGLPSVELKRLRPTPEYREVPRLGTYYYGFNIHKAPMDRKLFRQAIARAVDRQQIIKLLGGGEAPITDWLPFGMIGYEADRGLSFNPELARELVRKAGYKKPEDVPKIEISFNTRDDHQRIAENVQAQLKTNLGIRVELKNEEWKVYLTSLKTDPAQIFRMGWQADYPDPHTFMSLLLSFSENNYPRWKNTAYDELVLKAASLIDMNERLKLYSEAKQILLEDEVPVLPLYSSVNQILVSGRVENYPLNAMEIFAYKGARLK